MVNEITSVISNHMSVNIHGLNISGNDGIFEGKITVSVKNKTQLQKLRLGLGQLMQDLVHHKRCSKE